jgi:ABC-type phosphate transport system substrate-binding protein
MSRSRLRRLAGACAAAAAVAAVSAAPASADFSLSPCGGGAIQGSGATFQTNAHNVWGPNFEVSCFSGAAVSYNSTGSGTGRTRFLNRNFDLAAFSGTDEAPGDNPQGAPRDTVEGIQEGPSGSDNGVLETIPVTASSIAVIVNLPDGCSVETPVGETDPRVRLEKDDVEDIYSGDVDNWGQVPAINDACNVAINRVVRSDSSGTSFEFKKWLETVDDVDNDATDVDWEGLANTSWPDTTVNAGADMPGGQPLANKVANDDASIGYVVLGDGRDAGFQRATTGTDDEYWVPLRSGAPDSTTDPFVDPSEFGVTDSTKGANCDTAEYEQSNGDPVPTTTQSEPDWSRVVGFNSGTLDPVEDTSYSICALTYIMAWRDAADVDEDPAPPQVITEARQRTVRDYLEYILGETGQADALGQDYSILPTGVLGTASSGADRVCWNMTDNGTGCS